MSTIFVLSPGLQAGFIVTVGAQIDRKRGVYSSSSDAPSTDKSLPSVLGPAFSQGCCPASAAEFGRERDVVADFLDSRATRRSNERDIHGAGKARRPVAGKDDDSVPSLPVQRALEEFERRRKWQIICIADRRCSVPAPKRDEAGFMFESLRCRGQRFTRVTSQARRAILALRAWIRAETRRNGEDAF